MSLCGEIDVGTSHGGRAGSNCRRAPRGRGIFFVALAAALMGHAARAAEPTYNVLFIAIDDLRPQLHCYGHDEMSTPNIDRLASQGRLFSRQYVQVPTCGASRCALLTGRYPREPKAYDNDAFATLPRDRASAAASLPAVFQEHGYRTVSLGKITHNPDGRREDGERDLPFGWDETGAAAGKWGTAWDAFFAYADGSTRVPQQTPATEHADVSDDGYPDGLLADAAIRKLRELKDEPFFLAVGFFKPHLPFNAPERYWDLYGDNQIPTATWDKPPRGVDPAISLHKSSELTPRYTGFATPGVVTQDEGRTLRHAYAACVSYVDAQVGKLLDELDRLGLAENTIVVLWGDHGWHLGEHGIWGKHTLHEAALRSPLILRVPKMASPGAVAEGIVEAVDIFPTLAELCGLPAVKNVDGASFVRLLDNPTAAGKAAAYGFWAGGRAHSIRTDRYRLTQYVDRADPGRVAQVELYDHELDPDETENVAGANRKVVQKLTKDLHDHVPVLRERAREAGGH